MSFKNIIHHFLEILMDIANQPTLALSTKNILNSLAKILG